MTWRGRILVNPARIRAVNLERGGGDGGEYILADRALELLRNVAASLGRPRASRAWNLVGPYGAGKSAFAAFLVRLLGPGGGRLGALQTCAGRDPELADSFRAILGETRGFCPVLVTGAPEPLPGRFLARLAVAADFFFAGCEKENPVARSVFRAPAGESFGAAVRAMDAVNRAVVRAGGAGTLVVVDELGKFLEHEAAVPGANSAYFMQALAEHAAEAGAGRAAVFGLLHQGFDRYARGLGPDARREWEKVRGRFDEAAFAESPGQMTRIIARAIVRNLGADDEKKIRAAVAAPAEAVWKSGVLRGAGRRDAGETLAACYPLHPVAAALLPLLSQKLGQSERTMFSYLGGGQSRGFSEAVAGLRAPGDFVMPHHLYDYFVADRPMIAADPLVQKRWAEAVVAMDRLAGASPDLVRALKTVALFNLAGAHGNFAATGEMLAAALGGEAGGALAELARKSFITRREYSGECRIWQGSDFDLDEAEREETENIGRIHLAEELNRRRVVPPVVAHKHAIETGNLRRLAPLFVDPDDWKRRPAQAEEPRLIVLLPRAPRDRDVFHRQAGGHFSGRDIRAVGEGARSLEGILAARTALERIRDRRAELQSDPVAMREIRERVNDIAARGDLLARALVAPAPRREFHWRGQTLPASTRRKLQSGVSLVMDAVYDRAPRISNELINRDHPSPQAHAARKKLLLALHERGDRENLGIEKYPPEKAIYFSLFQKTGLHAKGPDGWRLRAPGELIPDSCNLGPVWDRIRKFIAGADQNPRSLVGLNSELRAAPYGVKAGVLPILYIAAILHGKDGVAVYEDDSYVPFFEGPHIERFLAKPESFRVQRVAVEGARLELMAQYAAVISGRAPGSGETILEVARPLLRFFADLPEYARQTETVGREARAFRKALRHARSPHEMLFADIPAALGFSGESMLTKKQAEAFAEKMTAVQRELQAACPNLRGRFSGMLARALGLDENAAPEDVRAALSARAAKLTAHAADPAGTGNFLLHAADHRGDGEAWLDRMMTFLAGKPPAKWADSDESKAEFNLSGILRRMADWESLLEFKDRINGAEAPLFPAEGGVPAKKIALPANLRDIYREIAGKINSLEEGEKLAILAELWHNCGERENPPPEEK